MIASVLHSLDMRLLNRVFGRQNEAVIRLNRRVGGFQTQLIDILRENDLKENPAI